MARMLGITCEPDQSQWLLSVYKHLTTCELLWPIMAMPGAFCSCFVPFITTISCLLIDAKYMLPQVKDVKVQVSTVFKEQGVQDYKATC